MVVTGRIIKALLPGGGTAVGPPWHHDRHLPPWQAAAGCRFYPRLWSRRETCGSGDGSGGRQSHRSRHGRYIAGCLRCGGSFQIGQFIGQRERRRRRNVLRRMLQIIPRIQCLGRGGIPGLAACADTQQQSQGQPTPFLLPPWQHGFLLFGPGTDHVRKCWQMLMIPVTLAGRVLRMHGFIQVPLALSATLWQKIYRI